MEPQLPDALDMLVSSMKAGYSLQAGMKFVGEELGAPIGTVKSALSRALVRLREREGVSEASS